MQRWTMLAAATVIILGAWACQRQIQVSDGSVNDTGVDSSRPRDAHPDTGGNPSLRLTPKNFDYVGAFRLPEEFAWGARGMSFYPGGNKGAGSLLITGFELPRNRSGEECSGRRNCFALLGEVEIPTPVASPNFESAPLAQLIGSMKTYDGGLSASIDPEVTWISDVEFVPRRGSQTQDKLYGSLTVWYAEGNLGDDSFPNIWFSNLDGSGSQGLFHVGPERVPFHGRKTGDYLFTVPEWYAEQYLGGRTLVTGRSRGTPVPGSVEAGGSQGPSLFAFAPFETDRASGNLDALSMLYYRVYFPECAGDNVGDPENCDYPNFTMCDIWTGGAFVEAGDQRAIMLLGFKGLGTNCYDHPPIDCGDSCFDDHGYHCNPYERQVILYDVEALGTVAQGDADPWSILPYAIWRPEEFFLDGHTCGDVGGMTFDPASGRLFMVERGLGGENQAAVHVWNVTE